MKVKKTMAVALVVGSPLSLALATVAAPKIAFILFGLSFFTPVPGLLIAIALLVAGVLTLIGHEDASLATA